MFSALPYGNPLWMAVIAAVLGLCIGSFLNVVIHRLPKMALFDPDSESGVGTTPPSLVSPPSSCPHCGHRIRARHNVPVFGYLRLRGRCPDCSTPISPRYPLVEILGGAIAVLLLFLTDSPVTYAGALVFSYTLLALLAIDLEHQLLPDLLTLPLLWCGLLFNLEATFVPLEDAVIGAAAGYLLLWCVYHGFRLITGKEGLGYGDFKLVAAIGAWVGWQMLPLVILLGSLAGALVGGAYLVLTRRGRDHRIPFGPFLAAAGWVAMFRGEALLDGYLRWLAGA